MGEVNFLLSDFLIAGQLGLGTTLGSGTGTISSRWPFLPLAIDDTYPANFPRNAQLRSYHNQDWESKSTFFGPVGRIQCSPIGGKCNFAYSCCAGACAYARCESVREDYVPSILSRSESARIFPQECASVMNPRQ